VVRDPRRGPNVTPMSRCTCRARAPRSRMLRRSTTDVHPIAGRTACTAIRHLPPVRRCSGTVLSCGTANTWPVAERPVRLPEVLVPPVTVGNCGPSRTLQFSDCGFGAAPVAMAETRLCSSPVSSRERRSRRRRPCSAALVRGVAPRSHPTGWPVSSLTGLPAPVCAALHIWQRALREINRRETAGDGPSHEHLCDGRPGCVWPL
jgi:hypothetical protein